MKKLHRILRALIWFSFIATAAISIAAMPAPTAELQAAPNSFPVTMESFSTNQSTPAPVPSLDINALPTQQSLPTANQTIQPAQAQIVEQSATTSTIQTILPATPNQTPPQPPVITDEAITLTKKPQTSTQEEEKKEIYLNFENAELSSFIDYIAEIKKLNILPDKTLEGSKISLTIREPLTPDGAWNVFLTVLEMAGFSIIEAGAVHKIIPKDKKIMQPLPSYINVPYDQLPDNDLTIRYVTFLTNIQVGDIRSLLESMLSTPNSIHDQKEMNAFIITDKSYNIKAAAKLIHELDQMGLPESVTVLRLKRTNAADVKALLDSLIRKPEGSPLARLLGKSAEGGTEYFSATTRVIPEERTNSLILLGNTKSVDKIVNFITMHIDTEIKEAESPLHIYELQNVDAKQIAEILKEVTQMPESTTGQTAGKYGSIRGGVKYFKEMKFQVDKDGNRLIISCIDKQDWKLLKKMLDDIDKPQPQVALESLIVTVNADDLKELGGAIRNKYHGQIGKNIDAQSASLTNGPALEYQGDEASGKPISLLGNMLSQIAQAQGQSVLTFGKAGDLWAVLHAIKKQSSTSILSQPFVTVSNKTTAQIEVGETKRIKSEEQGGTTPTYGYIDAVANTILKVTPQINIDGVIQLKIELGIKSFENEEGTKTVEKKLDTKVTVADGQVLVLGGFVKTKVDEVNQKTPILGDIPILGWFFKGQKRTITKQYIFIFMSPTIIKPRQSPGMQLYTKMKLHQATEDIEDAVETKRTQDPIHNWFFNPEKENYSHKVIDFANARYQPTTVDIKNDPYYHSQIMEDNAQPILPQVSLQQTQLAQPQAPTLAIPTAAPTQQPISQQQNTVPQTPFIQPIATPAPDTIIDPMTERRQKLKELLAHSAEQNRKATEPEFGTSDFSKKIQDQPHETLSIDPHKRNVLKDFLSAQRANAGFNNKTRLDSQKVAA
jgi:general secretion pathway protein D